METTTIRATMYSRYLLASGIKLPRK